MRKFLFALLIMAGVGAVPAQSQLIGPTIIDVLRQKNELSSFRILIAMTEFGDVLASKDVYTVFAPSDTAFTLRAQSDLEVLIRGEGAVLELIGNHVLQGTFSVNVIFEMLEERGGQMTLPTVGGDGMSFVLSDAGAVIINGVAGFVDDGTIAGNGIVHTIDVVLAHAVDGEGAELIVVDTE